MLTWCLPGVSFASASGVGVAAPSTVGFRLKVNHPSLRKIGVVLVRVTLCVTRIARYVRGSVDLSIRTRGARYLGLLAAVRLRPGGS
jgi:hypothetical protein